MKALNKVVRESANGDSLLSLTKDNNRSIKDISGDVRQLLTFQTVVETERELKREIREKQARKQQWVIGLLIGSSLTLLGLVIALASLLKNA